MKFSLHSLFVIVACLLAVAVAKKKDEEDQALKDLYTGMAGLKEAANNPALLAQLMRDLQVSGWWLRQHQHSSTSRAYDTWISWKYYFRDFVTFDQGFFLIKTFFMPSCNSFGRILK
jgi:hypothetical protein